MKKFFKYLFLIVLSLLIYSGFQHFIMNEKVVDKITENVEKLFNNILFNNFDKNNLVENSTFKTSGDYETIINFDSSTNIFDDSSITFDDEVLDYYKEVYECYSGVRFNTNDNSEFKYDLNLNNDLYLFTRLTDDEHNLFLCSKFTFDSNIINTGENIYSYINNLNIKSIDIYIPDDKFNSFIDIAHVDRDGINVINNSILSPYHLFRKGNNLAAFNVNYNDNGLRTSLIDGSNYECTYYDFNSKETKFSLDWSSKINKIADSIFVDLFNLIYYEEVEIEKTLHYDSNFASDLYSFTGRFESFHTDDDSCLSFCMCKILNDYYEGDDPSGRHLIIEYTLFDTITLKNRIFHLIIWLGNAENDGYGITYNLKDRQYLPVLDSISYIEFAEVIDNTYSTICSYNGSLTINRDIDVSNCIVNYDNSDVYYSDDSTAIRSDIMNVDNTSINDWSLVPIGEYDLPGLLFDCIFYLE